MYNLITDHGSTKIILKIYLAKIDFDRPSFKWSKKNKKLNEVLIFKESNFIKNIKVYFFNYKKTKYFEAIFYEIKKFLKKSYLLSSI